MMAEKFALNIPVLSKNFAFGVQIVSPIFDTKKAIFAQKYPFMKTQSTRNLTNATQPDSNPKKIASFESEPNPPKNSKLEPKPNFLLPNT